MKVILAHKYFYRRAGAETYLFDVMNLLKEHGHEVIPFSMSHPQNEKTPWSKYFVSEIDTEHPRGFIQKIKLAGRMIYSLEAKRKFEALIQETKPDIVHINNIYHQISPSILDVCKKYHIPVVQTVHDYKLICPNYKLFAHGQIEEYCKGGTFYKEALHRTIRNSFSASAVAALEMYIHKWTRIYDKGVQYWIAPTKTVKDILVDYGMPKERITVLPLPLDTASIAPSDEVGKYLLCYGRLSDEKGFDVAIRALTELPGVVLKIAGEGPQESYLRQLAIDQGVADRVQFLGFVTGVSLKNLVRKASIVLMPSIWYEVFGYSIIEAMAAGKVVVGSDIGSITDILGSVDAKLLARPGDSHDLARRVSALLKNSTTILRLGQKSRSWVQKSLFPEDYYDRLIELYKKAITQK